MSKSRARGPCGPGAGQRGRQSSSWDRVATAAPCARRIAGGSTAAGGLAHSVDLHPRAGPPRLVAAAAAGPGAAAPAPAAAAAGRSAVPGGRVPARLALGRGVALGRGAPAGHDGIQGFVHHVGHGTQRSGCGPQRASARRRALFVCFLALCWGAGSASRGRPNSAAASRPQSHAQALKSAPPKAAQHALQTGFCAMGRCAWAPTLRQPRGGVLLELACPLFGRAPAPSTGQARKVRLGAAPKARRPLAAPSIAPR